MNKPTYLLIRTKSDHTPGMTSFLVVTADVYEVDGGYLTNNSIGWLDTPRRYLDHLQVRAQADSSKPEFYGWEVHYADVMSVEQGKAKAMASTLAALGTRLHKMNDRLGYAETLAGYLARVALALDCGTRPFLRHYAEAEHKRYDDVLGYVPMDADAVRSWLNDQLRPFAEKYATAER